MNLCLKMTVLLTSELQHGQLILFSFTYSLGRSARIFLPRVAVIWPPIIHSLPYSFVQFLDHFFDWAIINPQQSLKIYPEPSNFTL